MKTINDSNTEQTCRPLWPDELQAVQGGSPTLPMPPPSELELIAQYRQQLFNHGYLYTVKASPSLM
jgi:hypothetical protein